MNRIIILAIVVSLFFPACAEKSDKLHLAVQHTVKDNYHRVEVEDSYRYLENLEDTLTLNWLKHQNIRTENTFQEIGGRAKLLSRLNTQKENEFASISYLRVTSGDWFFYLKKNPDEKSAKLYYRKGFSGDEVLLYDPKNFKPELNRQYSINYIQPSWNGTKIVVGLNESDKEISEMIVIDTLTKNRHPEIIDHCWPSEFGGVDWLPDNSGFIYLHIPVLDKNSDQYLLHTASVTHILGEDPQQDVTVFSLNNNPDIDINEEDFPETWIPSSSSKYIFSFLTGATSYQDSYFKEIIDLKKKNIPWKPLFKKEDLVRNFYTKNDTIIFLTSKNASNFKICQRTLFDQETTIEDVLIQESNDAIISDFTLTSEGMFYVKTINGVEAKLYLLDNKGNQAEIALPKKSGYINVKSKGYAFDDVWIEIEGWVNKKERYKYDYENRVFEPADLAPVKKIKELNDVIVEEIEITSHDGVQVPLSIIYKKGVKKDGSNRMLITGYGAYRWTNTPYFYPQIEHWVIEGGIYAIAHVRGGGEKGDAWHKGGYKTTKPNTWKDMIASTEYLIANNYTSKGKIAIWSASAGGICVGRAITERPDLYAASVIRVGVLNTLRSEFGANGLNGVKEYGTVKDSIEFRALYEMDAYHHIQDDVDYPAIYLTGGLNDARVPAWQPVKFAARMQEATQNKDIPVLLDIDFDGGHGFQASEDKSNRELANIMSFLLWHTGHSDYQLQN